MALYSFYFKMVSRLALTVENFFSKFIRVRVFVSPMCHIMTDKDVLIHYLDIGSLDKKDNTGVNTGDKDVYEY